MKTRILAIQLGKNLPFAADDRLFLGEGLFETIRVDNQRPCYSPLHWQRMKAAAFVLNIPFDLSLDSWESQLTQCIEHASLKVTGVKIILSAGGAPRGLTAQSETSFISFNAFNYLIDTEPLRLITAAWRRDANNPIYQIKSINYLESVIARRHAVAAGGDEALFFNLSYHATETTIANLFIIKNDQIYTPPATSGLLAGITRNRILKICADAKLTCSEAPLCRNQILEADMVFVSNVIQGIRVVKSLDGIDVPTEHTLGVLLIHLLQKDNLLNRR